MKILKVLARSCPPVGGCPAVYEIDSDMTLVVGKIVDDTKIPSEVGIAVDERAVLIPSNLLRNLPQT